MAGLKITQYSEDKYQQVVKFWLDTGLILSYSDKEEEINRLAKFNPNSFFLMFEEKQLIGTIIVSRDGRRGYVQHLAIHKSHQGQGLGLKLLRIAEEFCIKEKIVKIHLMIEKTNKDVVDFYEKSGWHLRNDLILMSKSLIEGKFEP